MNTSAGLTLSAWESDLQTGLTFVCREGTILGVLEVWHRGKGSASVAGRWGVLGRRRNGRMTLRGIFISVNSFFFFARGVWCLDFLFDERIW